MDIIVQLSTLTGASPRTKPKKLFLNKNQSVRFLDLKQFELETILILAKWIKASQSKVTSHIVPYDLLKNWDIFFNVSKSSKSTQIFILFCKSN